jgi:hypothetical protein
MTSNKTVTANLDIPQGSKELMDAVPEVYPNPATTFLSVRMPENAGNGKICITDAGGRVMMRKSVNFGINQVDISGLTEGFYTISIVSENYNKVCGFMVMRQ